MQLTPTPPTPTSDTTQQAHDNAYYRDILQGFVAEGATIARLIHDQAVALASTQHDTQPTATNPAPAAPAAPAAPTPPNPTQLQVLATAFDRVTRTVRRCIVLAQRLNDPRPTAAPLPAVERLLRTFANTRTTSRDPARDPAHRPARDLSQTPDHELIDRPDSLNDDNDDEDLDGVPIDDLIAALRRDLSLHTTPAPTQSPQTPPVAEATPQTPPPTPPRPQPPHGQTTPPAASPPLRWNGRRLTY